MQLVLGIDAIGAIKCNDLKVPLDLEQSEMNSMFGQEFIIWIHVFGICGLFLSIRLFLIIYLNVWFLFSSWSVKFLSGSMVFFLLFIFYSRISGI